MKLLHHIKKSPMLWNFNMLSSNKCLFNEGNNQGILRVPRILLPFQDSSNRAAQFFQEVAGVFSRGSRISIKYAQSNSGRMSLPEQLFSPYHGLENIY